MNLRRRAREEAEVESSSMNDIMFFLMLFFLIASTLANPNVIKIMLPKAKTTSTIQTKPLILTVKFDERDETKRLRLARGERLRQVDVGDVAVAREVGVERFRRDALIEPRHVDAVVARALRLRSGASVKGRGV